MLIVIVSIIAGWLLLNGFFYVLQPAMIFFPSPEIFQTPRDWGLPYEEVFFDTEDGERLHGWYLPAPGGRRVVLFFHGNAGNMSHRGDSIKIFHRLGLNVLIFDYRGYGHSTGKPSEAGLYRDARAAWRFLIERQGYQPSQIILFGRSLGGAVATHLAAEEAPLALIVESTFSSARAMGRRILPGLSWAIYLRYRFDTEAWIKQVHCPVLVIHSLDDEIIPFSMGEAIYRSANSPKSFYTLTGDHNSGFLQSQPGYGQALGQFTREID